MDTFIKDRLSVIVSFVLGGSTGWSLSGFIDVSEIKQWLIGIAVAFSLIISLLISINYKSSRTKQHKNKYRKYATWSAIIFLTTMTAFFLCYNSLVTKQMVNVQLADNSYKTVQDSTFIKGLYFTPEMQNEVAKLKQANPNGNIDMSVLFKSANNNIDDVWSNSSRTLAKLLILFTYIFFIASLIAVVTIATEMTQSNNKKNTPAAA